MEHHDQSPNAISLPRCLAYGVLSNHYYDGLRLLPYLVPLNHLFCLGHVDI